MFTTSTIFRVAKTGIKKYFLVEYRGKITLNFFIYVVIKSNQLILFFLVLSRYGKLVNRMTGIFVKREYFFQIIGGSRLEGIIIIQY
ncbi:hypothetical protein D3C75_873910 [compost metagenome]